jgi:hypothetical protein
MYGRKLRMPGCAALVAATIVAATVGGAAAKTPVDPGSANGGYGSQSGTVSIDNGAGSATVAASGGQGGSGSSGQGNVGSGSEGSSNCSWMPDPSQAPGTQTGGYDSNENWIPSGTPGQWYLVSCNGQVAQSVFVPGGGRPVPSPQMLMTQAKAQLRLPAPDVQLSPSTTHWQYVQMPTWVWLQRSQWVPLHATATVPGVSVTATAVPAHLVLTYEDGLGGTKTVTCDGPGTPYSDSLAASEHPALPVLAASPDCGWVWHYTAANSPDEKLEVTAHVVYSLSWTVTGAPGGGALPPLNSATSTYRLTVGEIQALNVPSPPP